MFKPVHINKLEMVRVEELTPMRIISDTECRFTREVDFSKIDIQELVGVTIEDSYENNQRVFTTTATFSTCCKKPVTDRHMAFRVTSVDGKRYMIGTNARPFPVVREKNPYPDRPADSSLKTVTIVWKSLLPMLHIIE